MPEAYVRIKDFEVNARSQVSVTVDTFYTEAAYRSGDCKPVKSQRMVMEAFDQYSAEPPKAQLYAWLKTQTGFQAAADAQRPDENLPEVTYPDAPPEPPPETPPETPPS